MRDDDYLVEAVYMCVRLGWIEWLGLRIVIRWGGIEGGFSLGDKNHVVCVPGTDFPPLSLLVIMRTHIICTHVGAFSFLNMNVVRRNLLARPLPLFCTLCM